MSLKNFIKKRPYLFWYIKDKEKISPEVAVEQKTARVDNGGATRRPAE